MPAAKVPEDTKGTLNVLPAQKGLPEMIPVVMELVTLGIVILILSTIIGGSECPDVPMLNHLTGFLRCLNKILICLKLNLNHPLKLYGV